MTDTLPKPRLRKRNGWWRCSSVSRQPGDLWLSIVNEAPTARGAYALWLADFRKYQLGTAR